MGEQAGVLLEALGIKATEMWPRYVAFCQLRTFVVLVAVLCVGGLVLWCGRRIARKVEPEPSRDDIAMSWVLCGLAAFVLGAVAGAVGYDVVSLLYPECAALGSLLGS